MNKNLMVLAIVGLFANNAFGVIAGRVTVVNDKNNPSDIWVTYFSAVAKDLQGIFTSSKYKCAGKCDYNRVRIGEDFTPNPTPGKLIQHAFRVSAYICQNGKSVGYDSDTYEAQTDKVRVKVIPQGNSKPKFVFTEEGDAYEISVTKKSGKNS